VEYGETGTESREQFDDGDHLPIMISGGIWANDSAVCFVSSHIAPPVIRWFLILMKFARLSRKNKKKFFKNFLKSTFAIKIILIKVSNLH
jgi:hypothetical protein